MKEQKILLIHTALFIITLITTTIAGAEWMYGRWLFIEDYSLTQEELWNGLSFSIPFLLILPRKKSFCLSLLLRKDILITWCNIL